MRTDSLIRAHILADVTALVTTLASAQAAGVPGEAGDVADMIEAASKVAAPVNDHETAAREAGYVTIDLDGVEHHVERQFYDIAKAGDWGHAVDTWKDACAEKGLLPYKREMVAFLSISDWLAAKLSVTSERVVVGFAGLNVWARRSDNDLADDPVLIEIARKGGDVGSFSYLQMEAALCAWEHMVENRDKSPYSDVWDGLGSSAMRACSIQAGNIVLAVHDHMEAQGYEHHSAYDWEFVPDVLNKLYWPALTADNQFGGPAYKPDVAAIFEQILAARPDDFEKRDRRAEWMERAKTECRRQWGYEGLFDDDPDAFARAFDAGEDAKEFVIVLGNELGLDEPDPYTKKMLASL